MALRKMKFLTKPRPFSFTIWARAATTTLSICVFEGQLATHRLQRRHLPRISPISGVNSCSPLMMSFAR